MGRGTGILKSPSAHGGAPQPGRLFCTADALGARRAGAQGEGGLGRVRLPSSLKIWGGWQSFLFKVFALCESFGVLWKAHIVLFCSLGGSGRVKVVNYIFCVVISYI